MKRTITFLGLLAITFGYAQEYQGKVGINTEQPKATLDLKPNPKNSEENSTTNEGLLIPRLSKTRVARIATPELSTIVYINSIAYTGNDLRVSKINAEGFYFWNGTEWTKIGVEENANIYTADGTLSGARIVNMGANNLSFRGTGNMGIGVVDSKYKLGIGNANYGIDYNNEQGLFMVNTGTSANAIGMRSIGSVEISSDTDANYPARAGLFEGINFKIGNQERARISENGNVGIGVTNPLTKLHVGGDIRGAGLFSYASGENTGGRLELHHTEKTADNQAGIWKIWNMTGRYGNSMQFWTYRADGSVGSSKMILSDEGNLAIGTSYSEGMPVHRLDVGGNARVRGLNTNVGSATDKVVVADANGVLKTIDRNTLATPLANSTTNIINNNTVERAALTGDVTAPVNSNVTTIANGAVTSAKIADGTITAQDLSSMQAQQGQVMRYDGTKWVASNAPQMARSIENLVPLYTGGGLCTQEIQGIKAVTGDGVYTCVRTNSIYRWYYKGTLLYNNNVTLATDFLFPKDTRLKQDTSSIYEGTITKTSRTNDGNKPEIYDGYNSYPFRNVVSYGRNTEDNIVQVSTDILYFLKL